MVEVVQMRLKEADRYAVIQQVIQRTMGQSDAALWLDISVRQVKRLTRAIGQEGDQGAVYRRWGVPGNRHIHRLQAKRIGQSTGAAKRHTPAFELPAEQVQPIAFPYRSFQSLPRDWYCSDS